MVDEAAKSLAETIRDERKARQENARYIEALPVEDLAPDESVVSMCMHGETLFVATTRRVFFLVSETRTLVPMQFKRIDKEGT